MSEPQTIKTSIFQWKDIVLKYKDGDFPSKKELEDCGFKDCEFHIVPKNFLLSDLFKLLGMSKSEFRRKLNEGALRSAYFTERKFDKDELLEQGISEFRIKRFVVFVWFLKDYKRKQYYFKKQGGEYKVSKTRLLRSY